MENIVIIPAHNEEKNIPSVIAEIRAALPGFSIVLVNDGSRDGTASVAKSLGISVVTHPVNMGYGVAVQTGFKYAAARMGEGVVILMDADGQHNAKDAPALVQKLRHEKLNMVIGSRFLGKNFYKSTIAREIGRHLFSLITLCVTGKRFQDITSGFQALDLKAVSFLSTNYPVDFPDAEVIIMMVLAGFSVAEAPADFRQRHCGVSMFSFWKKIYYPFKGILAIIVVILRAALTGGKQ